MNARAGRREPRRWKDWPRAEKYAFIQSQVFFWALYVAAFYLVATNIGIGAAVFVFGGGIVATSAATIIGIRRRRRKRHLGDDERR